jgi:hypothetical protein
VSALGKLITTKLLIDQYACKPCASLKSNAIFHHHHFVFCLYFGDTILKASQQFIVKMPVPDSNWFDFYIHHSHQGR